MRILKLVLIVMLALSVTTAFAEGKFGAQIWSGVGVTNIQDSIDNPIGSEIGLDRFFVKYDNQINKEIGIHVVGDVGATLLTYLGTGSKIGNFFNYSGTPTDIPFYLRNLYVDYQAEVMGMKMTAKLGIFDNVIYGTMAGMRGNRWVTEMGGFDLAKIGQSGLDGILEEVADFGAQFSFNIAKMVNVTVALTKGEGYTSFTGGLDAFDVAVYADVTLIDSLVINAFYKLNSDTTIGNLQFFGLGVNWITKSLKAGVTGMFVYRPDLANGSAIAKKYALSINLDAFVTVNTKEWIGIPLIATVKLGAGLLSDTQYNTERFGFTDAQVAAKAFAPVIGIGVGYEISKNLRTMVYYELLGAAITPAPETEMTHNIYIKVEAKI